MMGVVLRLCGEGGLDWLPYSDGCAGLAAVVGRGGGVGVSECLVGGYEGRGKGMDQLQYWMHD